MEVKIAYIPKSNDNVLMINPKIIKALNCAIEHDEENDYIECYHHDFEQNLICEHVQKNLLESIIYIYDEKLSPESIIRSIKYKKEENAPELVYAPFISLESGETIRHITSKYAAVATAIDSSIYSKFIISGLEN